jgi:hypothetical protein
MDVIYRLTVLENDDYFRSHAEFVCKSLKVEEVVKCQDIYTENGVEKRNREYTRYRIEGKESLVQTDYGNNFNTLEDLVKYFEEEYIRVHEDDYHIYFIDDERKNSVITISKPRSFLSVSDGYVDLYRLLITKEL